MQEFSYECGFLTYLMISNIERRINMTIEEKANMIVKLTEEIVEEVIDKDDNVGGLMRTFGNDYVRRMKTFASFFKDYKGAEENENTN
jgi:hypothetical protein